MLLDDYYDEDGCCLTCEDAEEGCLCFECKCTKCVWYISDGYSGGKCEKAEEFRASLMYWEDWEDLAKKVRKEAVQQFGKEPVNLQATFSNGTITKVVYYCYAMDIPHKIKYYLQEGYPYRYRTLLLKKVEPVTLEFMSHEGEKLK